MEELRHLALAFHAAADKETKDLVSEFFEAMDPNQKGLVTFREFSEYMRLIGRPEMGSEKFFDELRHASGLKQLEPIDILTLYYVLRSGRPFCDGCGNFIKGTFFTCRTCLNNRGRDYGSRAFNVCPQCVVDKNYVHDYDHKDLVDPFTLLHSRKMEISYGDQDTWHQPSASSYTESFFSNIADSAGPSNSFLNEVQERQNRSPVAKTSAERAAMLVQIALSFGNFLAAVGACTIM